MYKNRHKKTKSLIAQEFRLEVPTRFEDSRIFEITVRIGGFAALDICHANTHANLLNFQKTACNLITSGQIDREAQ